MSDITIPPYLFAYLPYVAGVFTVLAFIAISLPLAKKPIAGTTLRRQSIVAILVAIVAILYGGIPAWKLLLVLVVGGVFVAVYYRNHLVRKRAAEAIAAEKAAARKEQLASFLAEADQPSSSS